MVAKKPLTYADAGVSLDTWNSAKGAIGRHVQSTYTSLVLGKFGQFGGMFDVSMLKEYDKPILVSSVDGVGTKLKIASEIGLYDTVGEDMVNHCVDDILVMGAKPLFFLDYIAVGKLVPDVVEKIIAGLAKGCRESRCVLIGGETAEMPDMYTAGDFDLAGTIVGVVEESLVVDGSTVMSGDVCIGLRSNGLHTNGYSLARKIITQAAGKSYNDIFPATGRSFGQELLRPHRAYSPVLELMAQRKIKACAHITGGGFQDNLDRVLPKGCDAAIDTTTWKPDAIFTYMQEQGNVANDEMYHTFNMGVSLILVVDKKDCDQILKAPQIAAYSPVVIGEIVTGSGVVQMKY